MKAIGLWQPYAGLVRLGYKLLESRSWDTKIRGNILICSTRAISTFSEDILKRVERRQGVKIPRSILEDRGTMQCIVTITNTRLATLEDEDKACISPGFFAASEYFRNQKFFVWELTNIIPVKPIKIKCGQRWFNVPDHLIQPMEGYHYPPPIILSRPDSLH